jgi:hypothetical protein
MALKIDLATAFKNLVHEKVAIETVLKTSTPLEDLADVEALDSHLRNMAYKSEISMQEIKRLNEELRGTCSHCFWYLKVCRDTSYSNATFHQRTQTLIE